MPLHLEAVNEAGSVRLRPRLRWRPQRTRNLHRTIDERGALHHWCRGRISSPADRNLLEHSSIQPSWGPGTRCHCRVSEDFGLERYGPPCGEDLVGIDGAVSVLLHGPRPSTADGAGRHHHGPPLGRNPSQLDKGPDEEEPLDLLENPAALRDPEAVEVSGQVACFGGRQADHPKTAIGASSRARFRLKRARGLEAFLLRVTT